ncbi:prepilin-type N-terminal cleavage/methylation domain-containing protein [Desulfobacter postgatei]|uniref:Prepilin-type N-terminal cleavage/methylation domain-containing protein n=1 Tax=Desulfobacter postgatei 2ac9 TaxID=879212 RepID=I5B0T7_9BACT|nr:prepilin-type N-terminal cleavage/methylation domain-containing protein [Desulfobacter postgatei]EIM63100.1 prepilin-type N-terminal cleavage/methylation domain-containing protein [Desulfobacter postgatei 2ac9]
MTFLRNNQGFTLIESLIAMFVLAVGILALNTMQISSIRGNTSANKLTVASTLAGNSYERLLNVSYNDSTMDPATNPHSDAELTGLQLPSHVSSVSWNVTEWTNSDGVDNDGDGVTDESDELNIKVVSLNVNYNDGSPKTLTISFYKSGML